MQFNSPDKEESRKSVFVLLISQLHVDGFSPDFYNRDFFDEMIEMRVTTLCLPKKCTFC